MRLDLHLQSVIEEIQAIGNDHDSSISSNEESSSESNNSRVRRRRVLGCVLLGARGVVFLGEYKSETNMDNSSLFSITFIR